MLTEKQILEIREHLEKAQNPVFFFDNDGDGLCAFLLLQRFIGRGKGVVIKGSPKMEGSYFRKVSELNADYIFVLDKPGVSNEFFEEARQINIPVVWIDHHDFSKEEIPEFVDYYNPLVNGDENEPVAELCYKIAKKKEDMWIAVVGCISDCFIPDFYDEFRKQYPDLALNSERALDIYYGSELGKITKMFNFALKDSTTNVVNMMKFLMKAKSPYEVLEESKNNFSMHKKFNEINKKYEKLLEKAEGSVVDGKVLFFEYRGDLSISSEVANGLKYKFPDKIIVVAYVKEGKVNISVRGENVRGVLLKILEGFEDSTGGGHENAVGAKIRSVDLERFRAEFMKLVETKDIKISSS